MSFIQKYILSFLLHNIYNNVLDPFTKNIGIVQQVAMRNMIRVYNNEWKTG